MLQFGTQNLRRATGSGAPSPAASAAAPLPRLRAGEGCGRGRALAALAPALVVLARGQARGRRQLGSRRGRRKTLQAGSQSNEQDIVQSDVGAVQVPGNLYDLLGVSPGEEPSRIKQAYYDKMKVCHPDVAGDEGSEMCMLLNDAYDLLSDPNRRADYDQQVVAESGGSRAMVRYDEDDKSPTWKWQPKAHNRNAKPQWTGKPYSRSLWERVPGEDRGEKWQSQKFVFVDEWTCIACRNCCDVAPQTFCIDVDAGRARAYAQWGNSEEYLDYAVTSCPVDCIYWVSREELQVLEYVTRDRLHETGNQLPCPMAQRQGSARGEDPFFLASEWKGYRQNEKRNREKSLGGALSASAEKLKDRIQEVFGGLSLALRKAGWGR